MDLISSQKSVLVVGSLNVNPADRTLERAELQTLQLIDDKNAITPVRFFDTWGEMGMSSMCWHPQDPYTVFVATDCEVFKLCLMDKTFVRLDIDGLGDIHEVSIINDKVWITNTRHDQIVAYDLRADRISDWINLADFRSVEPETPQTDPDSSVVDRFHCNQVFQGYDGRRYILAHALSGRQMVAKIGKVVVKISALDGGVADIVSRHKRPLGLKAPHSVRLIADNYWVFDSARFRLSVFDQQWNLIRSMDTRGFGRGGDLDPERGIFYAGVSATRKRYLGILPSNGAVPNMVQVFDSSNYAELGCIEIPNIEQVLNVYCVDRDVADKLLELSA